MIAKMFFSIKRLLSMDSGTAKIIESRTTHTMRITSHFRISPLRHPILPSMASCPFSRTMNSFIISSEISMMSRHSITVIGSCMACMVSLIVPMLASIASCAVTHSYCGNCSFIWSASSLWESAVSIATVAFQ